jgi:hypothetical protein
MTGYITSARGYVATGKELVVSVSFDAKEFNRIKKSGNCPLAHGMAQIKNVVLDAALVRGIPTYQRASYAKQFPRASKGVVTLELSFELSNFNAQSLKDKSIDFNSVLENTRDDGHLFAKSAIASVMGH